MGLFDFFKSSKKKDEHLAHIGTPHQGAIPHSGRYPYGSGDNPDQHIHDLAGNVRKLKKDGFSEKEISTALKISTTEIRKLNTVSRNEELAELDANIKKLKEKGLSNQAIADKLGLSGESQVRARLSASTQARVEKTNAVIKVLEDEVNSYGAIDIGPGSEAALGIARPRLMTCAKALEEKGYVRENIYVDQLGNPGKKTTINILAKPGMTVQDIYAMKDSIGVLGGVTGSDGNRTALGIQTPASLDSKRVYVRYAEEGGTKRDGVIEVRRNVPDLQIGNSNYAQVRIAVDGTHYLKGMALYSDDIPKGYDVVFNTNKHEGTPMLGTKDNSVLKVLKSDPDNPFGTTLKMEGGKIVGQHMYKDKDGKEQLSPINIVREQGDWDTWSKTLASQFLSKQPIGLIKQQLNKSYQDKKDEYDEIMALTNPIIKQKLLQSFADDCDASAVHLKAAAMPRQSSKVILPFSDIKDNEIYAPTYEDGEEVILIRYPHGGTFEIPRLTVNNKVKSAKSVIGQAQDAVGINESVAAQLSGADFDGDTVVVIPTKGQKLISQKPLDDLKNFEPKELYKLPDYLTPEEREKRTMHNTQIQMGIISNLITDMTIMGADSNEIARAVRHSMVVIDAEKHGLDYKQSYKDNNIAELKKKYQNGGGASTIISRSKSPVTIPDRKEAYSTNGLTEKQKEDYLSGKKVYIDTGKTTQSRVVPADLKKQYGSKNLKAVKGEWYHYENNEWIGTGRKVEYEEKPKTIEVSKMSNTDNAFTLVSGASTKENEYANYANKLKALANESRKEYLAIKPYEVNKAAKEIYASEVDSLNANLQLAKMNKPLERKAQAVANVIYKSKVDDNPFMDDDDRKKVKNQALAQARMATGANKIDSAIRISDAEWEAIQAHAVSASTLREIIANTDEDRLKQLATPRQTNELSPTQIAKIKNYMNSGQTLAETARALGVSVSTVSKYVNQ